VKRRIRWVPEAAVRAVHGELIAEHGGVPGMRDPGLLISALASPRNRRVYGEASGIVELAAAYGSAIARNHPFIDGNKRVALMTGFIFLEMNGWQLVATEVDAVDAMVRLAVGSMSEKALADWIRTNSEKIGGA
jgi:death-on-curing protein